MKHLLFPKVKNFKLILPYIFFGIFVASIYGAIHNQITFAISPEYFTKLKFIQFDYARMGSSDIVFASIVGILATSCFGMFTGWFLGRFRFYSNNISTAKKDILLGFAIVFSSAILFAIIGGCLGYIRGYHFPINTFLGWEKELTLQELKQFIVVGFIHTAGYIGAFTGIFFACRMMKQRAN